MYGDSSFTILHYRRLHRNAGSISVPMFGDSSFTGRLILMRWPRKPCFRPHVWGFFFHSYLIQKLYSSNISVFVPMYGDSFFTVQGYQCSAGDTLGCFRPHVWGFFFTRISRSFRHAAGFSSPCIGILFSQSPAFIINYSIVVFVPMYGDSFFTPEK